MKRLEQPTKRSYIKYLSEKKIMHKKVPEKKIQSCVLVEFV